MSRKHPECPMYNPDTCREIDNPKYCALVREDKTCLRELQKTRKERQVSKETASLDQLESPRPVDTP